MAWTAPRTWVAGEIVTAAIMNTHVKDQLRYLKGLDGVVTLESGLTIANTDGDERLLLPLLSTAETTTVLNAEGEIAFDEQTHQMKAYDGTAIRIMISEADVDDTPVNGASTVPVSSNWAYDFINTLTTQADLPYATAAGVWTRLPKGTGGQTLRMNSGATAPEWAASIATKQFFVPAISGGASTVEGVIGDYHEISLNAGTEQSYFVFRVPNDFTTLTSVKAIIVPQTTGTFDWTVTTDFAAHGEAYQLNSDTMTADGQAATDLQMLELDISDAYTGLAANDIVGTAFTLDVLTTTSVLNMIGLDIKYS